MLRRPNFCVLAFFCSVVVDFVVALVVVALAVVVYNDVVSFRNNLEDLLLLGSRYRLPWTFKIRYRGKKTPSFVFFKTTKVL